MIASYERFGSLVDKAIQLWAVADRAPYGAFSIHYLPFNLYTTFFMAPVYVSSAPWLLPQISGMSLFSTTPALLLVLRAPFNRFLWLQVVLVMAGPMLVYSNGVAQLGARYWLLAMPFLMLIVGCQPTDRFAKILIGASIALMCYWMWCVRYWQPI